MVVVWGGYVIFKKQTPGGPIKIGVIAPLTGIVADYGEEIKRGVEAGKDEGVEIVYEDDKCEPKDAVSAFQKLVEFEKVKFIIGPGCGSPQEAIVPLLKDKDVIVLVPSAASRSLYEQSGGKFYNIQYALEDESKFIAEKMLELGHKKVVLISYQNAFSKTHEDSFKKHYKGEIVKHTSFALDTSDVSTELAKIKGLEYDAVFSTDITFFFANGLEKLRQFGIKVPVFSQYAVELPAVRQLVEGVIYSFPADVTEGEGAIFGLSKASAAFLIPLIKECDGEYACVKDKIERSGEFDETGVKVRSLTLKQIKDGQPVSYNP